MGMLCSRMTMLKVKGYVMFWNVEVKGLGVCYVLDCRC